jgi:hypothetical protein
LSQLFIPRRQWPLPYKSRPGRALSLPDRGRMSRWQQKEIPMTSLTNSGPEAKPPKPIEKAAAKTAHVQRELAIAEAELHLTNTVVGRALPDSREQGDLKKAVRQNAAIEAKVGQAAEELQEVQDLLHAEVAERQKMQSKLQRGAAS